MSEHVTDRALPPAAHEPRDVRLRLILLLFALTAGLLLLLMGVAWWLFPGVVKDQRFAQPFPTWPEPRLQLNAADDMRRFHTREMAQLNSAGWQDRAAGTVHIPIDQAMRAVVADGIPDWPGDVAASQGDRR